MSNITLPCRLNGESAIPFAGVGIKVKWSRVPDDGTEEMVLSSLGFHTKTFGAYNGRAFLQEADEKDASLVIMDATVSDSGRYRCEAVKGMEDAVYYIDVQVAENSLMDGAAADGIYLHRSDKHV